MCVYNDATLQKDTSNISTYAHTHAHTRTHVLNFKLTSICSCLSSIGVTGPGTNRVVLYLFPAPSALFLTSKCPKYKSHLRNTKYAYFSLELDSAYERNNGQPHSYFRRFLLIVLS